jgi:hypothetical protein
MLMMTSLEPQVNMRTHMTLAEEGPLLLLNNLCKLFQKLVYKKALLLDLMIITIHNGSKTSNLCKAKINTHLPVKLKLIIIMDRVETL